MAKTSYQQILDEMVKSVYTSHSGTTLNLTEEEIKQMLSGITNIGLSPEEQKELADLKAQHAVLIKAAKLAVFKKLPPDMRQFVINNIEWEERVREIESATADKPARLQELENKDRRLFIGDGHTFNGTHWYDNGSFNGHIARSVRLPEGLTVDELRQAHVEATLEEEVLHEQKD